LKGWACVKKASEYADVSQRTMREWLKRGLKHSRLPSGMIRIKFEDIDRFIDGYAVTENALDAVVDGIMAEL
jgi:hypothetical protein